MRMNKDFGRTWASGGVCFIVIFAFVLSAGVFCLCVSFLSMVRGTMADTISWFEMTAATNGYPILVRECGREHGLCAVLHPT